MLFKFLVSCYTFFFNFCRVKVQRFLPFSCDWNCFQWLTSFASLFPDLVQRCLQLFLQLLTSNSIDNSAPVIFHNLRTIKINRNCFKGFNLANSLRSIVLNLLVFCVNHDMDLLKEFRSFNQVEMRKFLWRFDKLTHAFGLPQNFAPPSINYRLSIQNHFLIKHCLFRHSTTINLSDDALVFNPQKLRINFRNFILIWHIFHTNASKVLISVTFLHYDIGIVGWINVFLREILVTVHYLFCPFLLKPIRAKWVPLNPLFMVKIVNLVLNVFELVAVLSLTRPLDVIVGKFRWWSNHRLLVLFNEVFYNLLRCFLFFQHKHFLSVLYLFFHLKISFDQLRLPAWVDRILSVQQVFWVLHNFTYRMKIFVTVDMMSEQWVSQVKRFVTSHNW